jgi:hypothetical protein
MLKVFKYQVPVNDYFDLALPRGARILTIQPQAGSLQMWALVDPGQVTEMRHFRFSGTGHPIAEDADHLRYVSTFQLADGGLVFHVFEVLP